MGRSGNNKLRPFVPMRRDMLDNPSFRGLSSNAKVIYLYLRKNTNGRFQDKVALPYSELKDMMAPGTISKGFKELTEAGFIKQVSKGGMYGAPAFYKLVGPFANPYVGRR